LDDSAAHSVGGFKWDQRHQIPASPAKTKGVPEHRAALHTMDLVNPASDARRRHSEDLKPLFAIGGLRWPLLRFSAKPNLAHEPVLPDALFGKEGAQRIQEGVLGFVVAKIGWGNAELAVGVLKEKRRHNRAVLFEKPLSQLQNAVDVVHARYLQMKDPVGTGR